MTTLKIDHVNVRTTQLDAMIRWYTDALGLRSGPRPNFPFPGAWMYAGDFPVVHLVGIDGDPGMGAESKLKLEHFAFRSTGCSAFEARLDAMGETYKRRDLTDFKLAQVNLWDPDGNHIHVDFPLDEENG
jgi:catechol 2,3-dioxygenase-like lactoylglutathione lyase family enzyme